MKSLENLAVRFSLRQPENHFVINPQTGTLVTFRPIDREFEKQDEFLIEVVAEHIGNPQRAAFLPVQVHILDENDNFPRILSPSSPILELPFPGSLNRKVFQIISKDDDKGINGLVQYSLIESTNIFSIDQTSGELWQRKYPKQTTYKLNVTVTDFGKIPKSIWSIFFINFKINKNKIQPQFLYNTLSMNLSLSKTKPGFVLGKISHIPKSEENMNFRYHLIAGKFSQIFSIHPISGEIKTLRPVTIDNMGNSKIIQLSVIVQSVEDPILYDVGKLFINIDYGNQNPPKFSRMLFKVKLPEDEAITDFITIAAHDPDLGIFGQVIYKLNGDVYDKKIFIDSSTGRLSCSPLNYVEKSVYNLQVIAIDTNGHFHGLSSSTKVTVLVQNTKQQSLEFNSTHFSLKVNENAKAGTLIGSITVVKPPINAELIYILNPGHPCIQINSSTGEIRTNAPLHRESNQFIDLIIQAFAKSLFSRNIQTSSAIIYIRIVDINDNYPIPSENPVKIYIPNTQLPPNPIARLSATDADKSSNITYTFDMKYPVTRSLSILYHLDRKSGNLYLINPIFNREKSRHFLQVVVSDNGSPNNKISVLLDISLNYVPKYVQVLPEKADFTVLENSPPGTLIGQLMPIDGCNFLNFSIIDGVNKKLVAINETSGKIFVNVPGYIDREKTDTIILWTQVICQNNTNRGYKKVIIRVEDIDDNFPVFGQSNYVAFLNEGQPPKAFVIRTAVYDPDFGINSQVEYFIELYSFQEEFSIDSNGEVRSNMPLNYHTKSMYNLVIKATSKSSPLIFAECRLTIYIININDQRPVISPPFQSFQLDTNSFVGSLISKISVKDSDGLDEISYRIRHRRVSNESLFLSVSYDFGEIFLSRKLTIRDVGKHELDIVVDDGKFSTSALIYVTVIDNNNHIPILRENARTVWLSDSILSGSQLVFLHAEHVRNRYNSIAIFELTAPSSWFEIRDFKNNSAALYLIDKPLTGNIPHFLGIQLTDSNPDFSKRLSSVSTIIIIQKSIISNVPIFLENSADFVEVSESVSVGSKVANVICRDAFSNQNVVYKIKNSNELLGHFHIDFESGDVFITKSLNYYTQQRFSAIISCEVLGSPKRKALLNMTIQVKKENKWFSLIENRTMRIALKVSDVVLLPILIYKLKDGNRNLFQFSFVLLNVAPDNPSNIENPPIFKIDSLSNLWLSNGNILQCHSWILTIMVFNETKPSESPINLYGSIPIFLHITIQDYRMAHIKKCVELQSLTGVIYENEPIMTSVLDLPNWYFDTKYTLTFHEHFGLFCDEIQKCIIKTKTVLDFEDRNQYKLELLVTGSFYYMKSCNHILTIEIFVLDVDEYSPEFSEQKYSHNVDGDIPRLGQILITIQATDNDRGRFGLIFYQFAKNPYKHFGIKNDTGQVYVISEFFEEDNKQPRYKRAISTSETPKTHKRTFQMQISASSGVKVSYANLDLTILVPGEIRSDSMTLKMTEIHVILLSTVPTISILLILIIAFIIFWKRKNIFSRFQKRNSKTPSSRSDSRRTSNSCNSPSFTPERPMSLHPKRYTIDLSKKTDHLQSKTLKYNTDNLPNSDTQDFNLSSEEDKPLTTSSLGTNENRNICSPTSEKSIKLHDQVVNNFNPEYSNMHFSFNKMNCDSGIGHGHRPCDYYDDSGMDNKRILKFSLDKNLKYLDSNISLTSSSGYSAISNNQTNPQHKAYNNNSLKNNYMRQNPILNNPNADSLLRDNPLSYTMISRNRPPPGLMYPAPPSFIDSSDSSEIIQLQNICHHSHSNNTHHNILPRIPTYNDHLNSPNIPFIHPYEFQPNLQITSPRLNISVISNNLSKSKKYAQKKEDVTEI